ncbi:MAG TPA: hypothetical protein VGP82_19990, partial [Ktedonobacterales bacterium]|nr:hypothetical protein [Ktedonobacterales bacterium]
DGGRKKWLDEVPHDWALFLICRTGSRSRRAAQFLTQIGYDRVTNIEVVPQPGARLASPLPNNVA